MRLLKFNRSKQKTEEQHLSDAISNIFGFRPKNVALYTLAFCHKSKADSTTNGIKYGNERLEYLGDAVLGSVVADFLFKKFPFKEEGFLTEMRSRIVSRSNLNLLSKKLGLDKLVQSNKDKGIPGSSIAGDAFEAFIGALYLDRGYEFSKSIIIQHIIQTHLDIDELMEREINFKSKVIEWAQKRKKAVSFTLLSEEENGKKVRIYTVELCIEKKAYANGKDFSIKKAEQRAAQKVWGLLQQDEKENGLIK